MPRHIATDTARPTDRRLGKTISAQAREETKDIFGISRLYKKFLTSDEIQKIHNKQYPDGSPGYFTNVKSETGEFDGEKYQAVEVGPYVITEYAMFFDGTRGACSRPKCGPFLNAALNENNSPAAAGQGDVIMAESVKADPPVVTLEDMKKLLNEAMAPMVAAYDARFKALEETGKQMNTAVADVTKFKADQVIALESAKKENYKKLLNAASQVDAVFEKLYPEMVKDLAGWQLANTDKLMQAAPDADLKGKLMDAGDPTFDFKKEQAKLWKY